MQRKQGIRRYQTLPWYRNDANGSRLKVQPSTHRRTVHYGQTWRHPWNRKYIMYRNAVGGGPSYGHNGSAQKSSVKIGPAVPEICLQTDRHTQRHTDRQTDRNTPLPYWGGVCISWKDRSKVHIQIERGYNIEQINQFKYMCSIYW